MPSICAENLRRREVVLVGRSLSSDGALIRRLSEVARIWALDSAGKAAAHYANADLWVVESGQPAALELIGRVIAARPDADVIIWNNGGSPAEIGRMFRLGARDCFPAQSSPGLLAERVYYLCRRHATGRNPGR